MYSYNEFPEQVESEMQGFAEENLFLLIEKQDDHCLRYQNRIWELIFYCDHGAVELSLINLENGFSYRLYDILELWFPDSMYTKKITENIWGSLETIKFNVKALEKHFPTIVKHYNLNKESLEDYKSRSAILIDFAINRGSRKLKKEFTWSSDNWIELASYEYSKSVKSKNMLAKCKNALKRIYTKL